MKIFNVNAELIFLFFSFLRQITRQSHQRSHLLLPSLFSLCQLIGNNNNKIDYDKIYRNICDERIIKLNTKSRISFLKCLD